MRIRKATERDESILVHLMQLLWPEAKSVELIAELRLGFRTNHMHYFLAEVDQETVGFCQLSFRSDYVPGAPSSPTAFLEGIYVIEQARHQDIATRLVETVERYATGRGCKYLASDTELENIGSQHFHTRLGFQEVERTVNYIKKLSHE